MNSFIETHDIFGINVYCSTSQWNNHIVYGHSIMANNKDAVIDTISSPDEVYQSNTYDTRKVYFKKSSYSTYDNNRFYTKVIVDYTMQNYGEIVTAFPNQGIKGGIGDVIYQK